MRVPTNLITGYLGVGKTTAIIHLLGSRPTGSRWAVLVNEFGEVAIDQVPLAEASADGVVIREVAGGCLCCSAGLPVDVAVAQVLRQAQPDRLLIETTGLGHPWRILDALRAEPAAQGVDLRATLCILDPRRLDDRRAASPTFQDQVHLADVLVANKADLADGAALERFQRWASSLFPPKLHVATVTHGQLDPEWLDIGSDPLRAPLFPEAHSHAQSHERRSTVVALSSNATVALAPGRPFRQLSGGSDYHACGWVFSPDDVFHEDRLMEFLLDAFDVERLKGVFRIGAEWVLVNRTAREVQTSFVAYRRDSRLEVIVDAAAAVDWDRLESGLLACLRTGAEGLN
jgi:G3E family GTPase